MALKLIALYMGHLWIIDSGLTITDCAKAVREAPPMVTLEPGLVVQRGKVALYCEP